MKTKCLFYSGSVTHWVRLGELDLETLTDEANTKDIEIIGIIVHPEYKYPNLYNDIALFRLKTSVTFNDYIRPICLNTHQRSNITRATVAGWGSTGYGNGLKTLVILSTFPSTFLKLFT